MGVPDKNYRENPARSLYISGPIHLDLVQRLTPDILTHRANSTDPITVYIDSPGGNVRIGEIISGLLRAPNADNKQCRVITVVTGHAASAAADLLASGDYSIAYPHALIHYHGVRQDVEAVTMEAASLLADRLRETNDQFAIRLATRSIERFMLLFLYLRSSEFDAITKAVGQQMDAVELFARALKTKVSFQLRRVIDAALERFRECEALDLHVWGSLKIQQGDSPSKIECDMLKLIVDYELKRNLGKPWRLSTGGLLKVVDDFTLLNDFNFGNQNHFFRLIIGRWQQYFLTSEEVKKLKEAETKQDEAGSNEIKRLVELRMQPIWYFVFSICKILQEKENPLSATDAYWLGIVDEVLGENNPCLRLMVEQGTSPPVEISPP